MPFDAHANLAVSTIAVAPTPPASGTSVTITAGHGARFPAVPFNATIWPANEMPNPATAEVVRVTAISTNTLTLTRAQEGTAARAILVGDLIAASITVKTLTDLEAGTNFPLLTTLGNITLGPAGTTAVQTRLLMTGASGANGGAFIQFLSNGQPVGYLGRWGAITGGTSDTLLLVGSSSTGLDIGSVSTAGLIRFLIGAAFTERGRIYPGGGFAWGTTTEPAAGRMLIDGGVASQTGTYAGAPTSTWVTLFTMSNSGTGLYLVQVGLGVDAVNYGAFAHIMMDGPSSARMVTNDAPLMTMQLSGMNVQAKQASGGPQPIRWNALRIQ